MFFNLFLNFFFLLCQTGAIDCGLLRNYEPLYYDATHLSGQHHLAKRATTRAVKLNLRAFGRHFPIRLRRDTNVIAKDFYAEDSKSAITLDLKRTYTGFIENDPSSYVYGMIDPKGRFEGNLHTSSEIFSVEPAEDHVSTPTDFHSVMFRHSDLADSADEQFCRADELAMLMRSELDKIALKDQLLKRRRKRATYPERNHTVCTLYMQADYELYQKYGDKQRTINRLVLHVQAVNEFYKRLDLLGNGEPTGVTFVIKRAKVWTDTADSKYRLGGAIGIEKYLERFSSEPDSHFDKYCLAYSFTHRDFSDGTLGLAWIGETYHKTGICEKTTQVYQKKMNLNTGVVTLVNYGKTQPLSVSALTFAHEIGHNFGAHHDPYPASREAECIPLGDKAQDGHYVMWSKATSGLKPNNKLFSACSLDRMKSLVRSKASCFIKPESAMCGNSLVEPGEMCDCGWDDECTDKCCISAKSTGSSGASECRLESQALCSPTAGECCDASTCKLKSSSTPCGLQEDCKLASYCNGVTAQCPGANLTADLTQCGGAGGSLVCLSGECVGSGCLLYEGLEGCQCTSADMKAGRLCDMCCQRKGQPDTCRSSAEWTSRGLSLVRMQAGSPCNAYEGYCDVYLICREVNPAGLFSRLKSLFTTEPGQQTLKAWLIRFWWVLLLAFILLYLLIALLVLLCARKVRYSEFDDSVADDNSSHAPLNNETENPPRADGVRDLSRFKPAEPTRATVDPLQQKPPPMGRAKTILSKFDHLPSVYEVVPPESITLAAGLGFAKKKNYEILNDYYYSREISRVSKSTTGSQNDTNSNHRNKGSVSNSRERLHNPKEREADRDSTKL